MAKITGNKINIMNSFVEFYNQSPYMSFVKDVDCKFLAVSKSLAEYFGVNDPASLIGKTSSVLLKNKIVCSLYEQLDKEVLNSDESVLRILPSFVDPSGNQHYVQVSKTVIKDTNDEPIGIIGDLREYTAIYEAKKRFDRQIANMLSLPDNSNTCAYIDITDWKMLSFSKLNDSGNIEHPDITIENFLTSSDRVISNDANAHRFFTEFNKNELLTQFNAGESGRSEEFNIKKEDSDVWMRFSYTFVVDPINNHVCGILSVFDIKAQHIEMDNLIKAAEQDSMTSLYNRESAMGKIDSYLKNYGKDCLNALFIVDIDNFKNINDHFGHRTGDTVIVDIAQKISSSFRETDIIGRIDGDEFIVLMKNLESAWAATNKANELINILQYECRRAGESVFLTSSIGITVFSGDRSVEDLYSEANEALYRAKSSGKNKYMMCTNSDYSVFDSNSKVSEVSLDLKTVLNGIDGVVFIVEVSEDDIKVLYSSANEYNQDVVDQMPAEEYNRLLNAIVTAHRDNKPVDYTATKEHTYLGKSRWIHVKGTFINSDNPDKLKVTLVVTDISNYMNSQQLLELENTKNTLAVSISNIMIWEYDATTKLITLNSSKECIPYYVDGMCYQQSENDYLELYNSVNSGVPEGSAFINFKSFFGKTLWMQVSFKTTFDKSNHVVGALFAATDITSFINSMDKYVGASRRYSQIVETEGSAFNLNLSENKLIKYTFANGMPTITDDIVTADDFFKFIINFTSCSEERRVELTNELNAKAILNKYNSGSDMIEEELFYQLDSFNTEWFILRIYMVVNPESNDVEVFGFMRNIHSEHTSQQILDSFMKSEYELIAVIDTTRSLFRIIQESSPRLSINGDTIDYDEMIYEYIPNYFVENDVQNCAFDMSLHNLIKSLETEKIHMVTASVYEKIDGQIEIRRKRYQYAYIDDNKRYIACTKTDITDQYKSEFDPVSGLYNRNAFYVKSKELINNNPSISYVIVRWDIDKFKLYNDTFGTVAGDELLAMIGNAYRERITSDSLYANLGADNFVICMPSNKFDPDEQIDFLNNFFLSFSENYNLTFHMSGYRITDPTVDIGLMCDRAAIAVKSIKEHVQTRFIWYDESMRDEAVREQELVSKIKLAFNNDEFIIYIQPQINQMTGEIVAGEVLVRWQKPDGTMVSPGEFIPIMEKNGLISRLDEIVWEKTAKYISDRKSAGLPIVPLAVNISRRDFYRPHFCEIFYDLIDKYNIEPKYIDLEITESAYIENTKLLISIIKELRSNGFKVKMDDFGTGYSSLNTLKDVPVDMVKLDMKFITFDESDEATVFKGGVILDSVLRMTHWLGLPVIAEGVETAKQAEFLKSIDCSIIQGYYFSKPLPADKFSALLDEAMAQKSESPSSVQITNSFDNYDFWNPASYSAILFNSFIGPAGIFEYHNGKITLLRINESFYTEIGTTQSQTDFYNMDFFDLIKEEEINGFHEFLEKISKSSDSQIFESQWVKLPQKADKKEYIWLNIKARRIAINDTRFVFFASIENTTERKNLEIRNTNLAVRLSAFLETIPGGAFVFEISNEIKITYMSSKLYSIFGYNKSSSRDVNRFHPIMGIHPSDRDKVFDAIWSDFNNTAKSLNVRHICKGGNYIWVNLTINPPTFVDGLTIGYCVINSISNPSLINENLYEIEAIASHSDRLISRFNLKSRRLVHYFQFSDYFDIPDDASVETLEDIGKYDIIQTQYSNELFLDALVGDSFNQSVILTLREKNKQYAPYRCQTSLVRDPEGVPLFAIMSLQKIINSDEITEEDRF